MIKSLSSQVSEASKKLTIEKVTEIIEGIGLEVGDSSLEELQKYVFFAVIAGDLHPRDILNAV